MIFAALTFLTVLVVAPFAEESAELTSHRLIVGGFVAPADVANTRPPGFAMDRWLIIVLGDQYLGELPSPPAESATREHGTALRCRAERLEGTVVAHGDEHKSGMLPNLPEPSSLYVVQRDDQIRHRLAGVKLLDPDDRLRADAGMVGPEADEEAGDRRPITCTAERR